MKLRPSSGATTRTSEDVGDTTDRPTINVPASHSAGLRELLRDEGDAGVHDNGMKLCSVCLVRSVLEIHSAFFRLAILAHRVLPVRRIESPVAIAYQ